MSDHISGPRALSDPDRRHHRRVRLPEPGAAGPPRARHEHAPVRQAVGRALRGADLPLPAAAAHRRARPATRRRSRRATMSSSFDCVFSPHVHPNGPRRFEQEGTCTTPAGETVTFRVNDPAGGEGHGVRVFAGARWDPFIMDAPAALKTIATGKLAFTDPSSIFLDGKNVLSLVVELDTALLGGAELVGRRRRDAHPRRVQRADRARRAPRGQEHDAGPEAVRPGQPRPRDPRPLQHARTRSTSRTATSAPTGPG